MSKNRTKPSKEMIADLRKVFKKHNWRGNSIGIERTGSLADATAADMAPRPAGQTLQTIGILRPDGTTEVRVVCM